jgi:ribosome-binding factor A
MQGDRKERIGELIRHEMGQILLEELKDPRIGFVTITHVVVSPDLHYARIVVSVFGTDAQKKKGDRPQNPVAPQPRDFLSTGRIT